MEYRDIGSGLFVTRYSSGGISIAIGNADNPESASMALHLDVSTVEALKEILDGKPTANEKEILDQWERELADADSE